ncbi:helix-turn-helix transcriptional regulator [Rhodoplanes sp. Z2-YC6860]|uniref:helix-turn-helix transcriptional regulator n=1 Tax=Rhodoplanes sp. Z2-YC6860 TaxID=674703 RepID=UPI00078B7A35|nr:helix-turn-helix domain-containing protein [Rhodoplanes sp. Z2-YC6860]AMN39046.1 phage transcriptional regulator AlpA [Rhodoplanes sp. Z2-YC6860]
MKFVADRNEACELLNEVRAAAILGLSIRTLQAWRAHRTGPRFVRAGRAIRYRRSDLSSWIDSNTIGSVPPKPERSPSQT